MARGGSPLRVIEPETATTAMASLIRTRAVVNETLRLFPSVFTIVRDHQARQRCGGRIATALRGHDRALGSTPSP